MLTFSWEPSGTAVPGPPSSRSSVTGATLARTWPAPHLVLVVTLADGDGPGGIDAGHLGAGADVRPGGERRVGERGGDRAHPADRDVPRAGPVADHVVEETAVLQQAGLGRPGERADHRVGQHYPADQIGAELLLQRLAERALGDHLPGRAVPDDLAHLGPAEQRRGHRRRHPAGQQPGHGPQPLPGVPVRLAAGDGGEGGGGPARVGVVHQQAGVALRRVGPDAPRPELDRQAQLADDARREQADQVGVPGQPDVHAGERRGGDGGAADVRLAFGHQHRPAGPGQVGGRGQAVVATADHHGVIAGRVHGRLPAHTSVR